MSRPNLARLEPSAYSVLSVADPVKVATQTEQVLGELDLDHLCRLLIRSERSLSLVNRRSFAAALADVPPVPNQALRPAPPFPDAVAVAREDGKLLERTRRFLAQNPRALEELTPELTLALLRHFDPTMRVRSTSPFTHHVVAVGSVTVIALIAAVLGIVHTQQNQAVTASINRENNVASRTRSASGNSNANLNKNIALTPHISSDADTDALIRKYAARQPAAAPPAVAAPAKTSTAATPPTPASASASAPVRPSASLPVNDNRASSLFVREAPASTEATTANTPTATNGAVAAATVAQQAQPITAEPNGVVASPSSNTATNAASPAVSPTVGPATKDSANATAMVLRTIISQNPQANVEWIRSNKASDHIITVTSKVHSDSGVSQETYRLYNSNGQLTVIDHHTSTP